MGLEVNRWSCCPYDAVMAWYGHQPLCQCRWQPGIEARLILEPPRVARSAFFDAGCPQQLGRRINQAGIRQGASLVPFAGSSFIHSGQSILSLGAGECPNAAPDQRDDPSPCRRAAVLRHGPEAGAARRRRAPNVRRGRSPENPAKDQVQNCSSARASWPEAGDIWPRQPSPKDP